MKTRRRALVLVVGVVLGLVPALPAAAHVPPDTGLGGQDACVSDSETHEVDEVVAGATAGTDCGL